MLYTLPCETLMSAKQAVNDKLQGSVATYLRCGKDANIQINSGLLLSLSVNFLNRQIFDKVTGKNVIALCTFIVLQPCFGQAHKVHETSMLLVVTLTNIHRFKKNNSFSDSAINLS